VILGLLGTRDQEIFRVELFRRFCVKEIWFIVLEAFEAIFMPVCVVLAMVAVWISICGGVMP